MAKKATEATAKKAVAKKDEVFVQFDANEIDVNAVVAEAKAAFKAEMGRKAINTCKVYVKPQENAAYYVINEETQNFTGKIAL